MASSLAWHEKALEDLKKIDKPIAEKIIDRVETFLVEDPEGRGDGA